MLVGDGLHVQLPLRCVAQCCFRLHAQPALGQLCTSYVDTALCMLCCLYHSQVLGEMQLGGKVPQRWLAHSIRSVLSQRYPSLRIAYIDLENLGELPAAAAKAGAIAATASPFQPAKAGPSNRGRGNKEHRLLRQCSVLLQYDVKQGAVVELYRWDGESHQLLNVFFG